jgi:hypothetical protein
LGEPLRRALVADFACHSLAPRVGLFGVSVLREPLRVSLVPRRASPSRPYYPSRCVFLLRYAKSKIKKVFLQKKVVKIKFTVIFVEFLLQILRATAFFIGGSCHFLCITN